jgi:undecaprenyl-diphosphatase
MNYHLFQLINGWAGHSDGVDDVMEFTATTLIYVVFAVAAVLGLHMLWHRRFGRLIRAGAALALAFAAATVVSLLSHEVRPFQTHHVVQLIPHEAGSSLPSDHATAGFTLAAVTAVFLYRLWAAPLAAAAAAIGFARVWVGVHYPGDIAASLLIALAATAAVIAGERLFRRFSHVSAARS